LLAALAAEDREAADALLQVNPSFAAIYQPGAASPQTEAPAPQSEVGRRGGAVMHALRRVLRAAPSSADDAGFRQAVEDTKAQLSAIRRKVSAGAPPVPAEPAHFELPREAAGVLTSMTRQLSPELALELYRKIAPLLAFAVLKHVERSASLDHVQAVAEHLCAEPVQTRLRAAEHVRDALVDELCTVLGDTRIKLGLNRRNLMVIMEESGATADLSAMVNCITLSKVRAG
jgi:hypothetical protein